MLPACVDPAGPGVQRVRRGHFFLCYNPCSCIQVIIPLEVGVQSLKRALILLSFLLLATLTWMSCGSAASPSTKTSGVKYRAFITNNVSSGTAVASIDILDAQNDIRPPVSPISAGNTPGMMVVTPNRAQTLVFSGNGTQFSDNSLSAINNASEQNAGHISLPGMTESFVVSPDSSAAYVAVPTAPVVGQSPGIVEAIALSSISVTGQVNVPSVHYLSMDNSGNRILGFSDVLSSLAAPCLNQSPSFLFIITPSNIGVDPCPVIPVPGLDHPVQAFFSSDDSTAYIVNCGGECGGAQASVQPLDLSTCQPAPIAACGPPGTAVPVEAASEALVNGSTMYLAGSYGNPSAPPQSCPGQSAYTPTCGSLSIVDLSTMAVTASGIAITDGYHNRIALGANGQLFVGARTCTEAAGVSGCLSIYNTTGAAVGGVPSGGVLIPPANGDVTGIQPVATRQVVYVVQGGELFIYDATTDALYNNPHDPNNPGQIFGLVGNFIDVKTIDF